MFALLFDLEDYATTYRATRDAYLKAANELKLATGPYKAARDAYVAATATYTTYTDLPYIVTECRLFLHYVHHHDSEYMPHAIPSPVRSSSPCRSPKRTPSPDRDLSPAPPGATPKRRLSRPSPL